VKKITVPLSDKGITNAIKQLNVYKRNLNRKIQALIAAMVAYGEDYAINEVGHVDTGETLETIRGYRNGNKGVIVAGGNAVWLEFGSGTRYNGPVGESPHPMGVELGMTIGEYGEGRGANPNGWWYYDESGQVKHTYGIPATLFMWKTARELERIAPELAREVFKT
jgi:hypothetical protein